MNKSLKKLNFEERELIKAVKSIDESKLTPIKSVDMKRLQKAARSHIQEKETKMNIRISSVDLETIKQHAREEGLKYSTFVKSVLHKYVTGQLVVRSKSVVHN
jgi:predicted DNA binding CopG/RHH family protein